MPECSVCKKQFNDEEMKRCHMCGARFCPECTEEGNIVDCRVCDEPTCANCGIMKTDSADGTVYVVCNSCRLGEIEGKLV